MKMTTLKSVAIAVGLASSAFGQATSPVVGYVTETIVGEQFNFIGLNLHGSVSFSGTFGSSTDSTLTDPDVDFSGLDDASTFAVRLTGGNLAGTVIEVPADGFSGNTISGLTGITADFETTYEVREAATLASVFGANNEIGLQEGNADTADIISIPGPDGLEQFFFATPNPPFVLGGWTQVGVSGDASNTPIIFTDGIIVQRRGESDIELVVAGSLISTSAVVPVDTGFNFVSSVFPQGVTLENSGLEGSVTEGDPDSADIIWITTETGLEQFFFATPNPPFVQGGWTQIGVSGDASETPISSGYIFQRRGAPFNALLTPPASYSGL